MRLKHMLRQGAVVVAFTVAVSRGADAASSTGIATEPDLRLTSGETLGLEILAELQPPTDLVVWSMTGERVTLRWKAPTSGPEPKRYFVECAREGQVLL